MGYTHYWTISPPLNRLRFVDFSNDCRKIIDECEIRGIAIADWDGESGGPEISESEVVFNGLGNEAHEPFRILVDSSGSDFCKTAGKAYDLAVTSCLIAAKHHFGHAIEVTSDGEEEDWADARALCQSALGYGSDIEVL